MAAQLKVTTVKLNDRELVERWLAFARALAASGVSFRIGGENVCNDVPVQNPHTHAEYKTLESFMTVGAANLEAAANFASHGIRYTRGSAFDEIIIDIASGQQRDMSKTAEITAAVNEHFVRVDLNASLMEVFNDDLKRYYQAREATLIRLEQLSEKLINDNQTLRLQIEREKDDHRQAVDGEYKKKEEGLDQRKQQLDKREQEMDLADAKSTRRKLRQDILGKLTPVRTVNVGIRKTWPIHAVFVVVSMTFLALGLGVIVAPGFDPLQLMHAIKLGLSAAVFGGTLILYYRWMDAWIRKGVDEELRLRQLGIDVERSTWVVEMLSELKSETEKPIPDEVLAALTRNLFTGTDNTRAVTHPAEDVLAALLGSSREIELDFPGGKVRADGRGVRKAARKVGDDAE